MMIEVFWGVFLALLAFSGIYLIAGAIFTSIVQHKANKTFNEVMASVDKIVGVNIDDKPKKDDQVH